MLYPPSERTTSHRDPTGDELRAIPVTSEADEFDIEAAIYWYAHDYYTGRWSNLYSVLLNSKYTPGLSEDGPVGEICQEIYDQFVEEFSS